MNDDYTVSVYITSDFFPERGFKHGIKRLTIVYKKTLESITKELGALPDTLEYLDITGNRQPLSLPDISNLDKLKSFTIYNASFSTFPDLPKNLEKLSIIDCIVETSINRQFLQPGFLPSNLKTLSMLKNSGFVALPLLPMSIVRLVFTNLNSLYKNNEPSGNIDLTQNKHETIERLNATTNKIKSKLNYGEIGDMMIALKKRGNPHETFAIEMEKDLMKEYLESPEHSAEHSGGSTKIRIRNKRKTKNKGTKPTSRAHTRRTMCNRRRYHRR